MAKPGTLEGKSETGNGKAETGLKEAESAEWEWESKEGPGGAPSKFLSKMRMRFWRPVL